MKNSVIRETVFQQLFMAEFFSAKEKADQSELFLQDEDLLKELELEDDSEQFTEAEKTALKQRFLQVTEKLSEIDQLLNGAAEGWKTSRMPLSDLCILRLAVFELLFDEAIPEKVAINEAVELAKKYGSEAASAAFVNGVLGKVVREKQ